MLEERFDGKVRYVVVWQEIPEYSPYCRGPKRIDVVEAVDRPDALDRFLSTRRSAKVLECASEFDFMLHHETVDGLARDISDRIRQMGREWERENKTPVRTLDCRRLALFGALFIVAFVASFTITQLILG